MYLVIEEQSKQAIAVDPAVPHRVSRERDSRWKRKIMALLQKKFITFLIEKNLSIGTH